MFENFNESAKRIIFYARYEATQLGSQSIGSEHLLLGLLKENDEIPAEVFSRSRIPTKLLQAEIQTLTRTERVSTSSVDIPVHSFHDRI